MRINVNATLSISSDAVRRMSDGLGRRLMAARPKVHQAMAQQFHQCTMENFGAAGAFRPHRWKKLSARYAKIVKRDYATLEVTGKLKHAIKASSNSDRGRVSVSKGDVVYAFAHQFGNPKGGLPDRPYFPIVNGKILNPVQILVVKAGQLALNNFLK